LTESPLHPPADLSNLLVLRSKAARVFAVAFISLNTLTSTSSLVLSLLRRPQRYQLGMGQRAAVCRPPGRLKRVLLKSRGHRSLRVPRFKIDSFVKALWDLPRSTGQRTWNRGELQWWLQVASQQQITQGRHHVPHSNCLHTRSTDHQITLQRQVASESLRRIRYA
jgi:hypothetical protein